MSRMLRWPALACCLVLGSSSVALALTVVVPTDFPTIKAAIESGADVVKVNDGTYAEDVVLSRTIELEAGDPACPGCAAPFPTIAGTVDLSLPADDGTVSLSGFRVTGALSFHLPLGPQASVRDCRLDGGLVGPTNMGGTLRLRGCQIRGGVSVFPATLEMTCCTLIDGGLTANYEFSATISNNYIVDSKGAGIWLYGNDPGGSIRDNVVANPAEGIVVEASYGVQVANNVVRGARGDAFRTLRATGNAPTTFVTFDSNTALDPSGDGFDFVGFATLRHNTVIRSGGFGIVSNPSDPGSYASMTGNMIDRAGLDGIRVSGECVGSSVLRSGRSGIVLQEGTAAFNTVGRSVGDGIVLSGASASSFARNNTLYLNSGAGLRIAGDAATPVQNNIAYGNTGYGLVWTGPGAPALGCNDWFVNGLGAVQGAAPAATDLAVNPQFCNLPADVVTLAADSPLAGTPCGSIGAAPVGCALAVDAPAADAEGALAFTTGRSPAHGSVTFGWRPRVETGSLDVFDARGARVWGSAVKPGTSRLEWGGVDARGEALGPGVYFARIAFGPRSDTRRIVLMK